MIKTESRQSSNTAAWLTLAVLAIWLAILEAMAPVPITLRGMIPLTIACLTLGSVAHYYRTARPNEQFANMCVCLSQVLLFSAIGAADSYLVARTDYPLWDPTLARWDHALGFDWLAAMHFVDQSVIATVVLEFAYFSLIPQVVVLVCALGFQNRMNQLRTVMLSAMLCGAICIAISAFMPAVAYGVYFHVQQSDFHQVFPWAGFIKMPDFNALRSHTIAQLDFVKMQGIITFPSYHAGLSAVTLWGFLNCRKWWIRFPGATLAALTIISTPVDGGHYLVDVIAGIAIGAVCIAFAARAIYFGPLPRAITALPFRRSREAFAP